MATVMTESTEDEIVQLTGKLGMEQEKEWEVVEAQTNHMWKAIGEWKVKAIDEEKEHKCFGVSFASRVDAKKILEKQHWLFNGGMLVLEEWPTSGQWRDASSTGYIRHREPKQGGAVPGRGSAAERGSWKECRFHDCEI
uniref:DUF4283 domain-containing protein n=1 Tax=Cannabis sativa TaxID=3483 RepID=A0A803NHF7_CANSA